jgi:hypothetical protein
VRLDADVPGEQEPQESAAHHENAGGRTRSKSRRLAGVRPRRAPPRDPQGTLGAPLSGPSRHGPRRVASGSSSPWAPSSDEAPRPTRTSVSTRGSGDDVVGQRRKSCPGSEQVRPPRPIPARSPAGCGTPARRRTRAARASHSAPRQASHPHTARGAPAGPGGRRPPLAGASPSWWSYERSRRIHCPTGRCGSRQSRRAARSGVASRSFGVCSETAASETRCSRLKRAFRRTYRWPPPASSPRMQRRGKRWRLARRVRRGSRLAGRSR